MLKKEDCLGVKLPENKLDPSQTKEEQNVKNDRSWYQILEPTFDVLAKIRIITGQDVTIVINTQK